MPHAERARGAALLVALAAGRADVYVGSLVSGELPGVLLRVPRGLTRPEHRLLSISQLELLWCRKKSRAFHLSKSHVHLSSLATALLSALLHESAASHAPHIADPEQVLRVCGDQGSSGL